jgi:ubiquitin-like 1-activating enzyme E1 B
LFGEEDADQDVSPDTDDPELGGSAGQRALEQGGSDGDHEPPSKNGTNGSDPAATANGGDSNKQLARVSTRAWAKEVGYDPKKLFMKFFNSDIKYLLSMDKLWEKRRPPTPLDCDDLPEGDFPITTS